MKMDCINEIEIRADENEIKMSSATTSKNHTNLTKICLNTALESECLSVASKPFNAPSHFMGEQTRE